MIKSKLIEVYEKIEERVVSWYKKIEEGAVETYNKILDKFVECFLTRDRESIEDAKARLAIKQGAREKARKAEREK